MGIEEKSKELALYRESRSDELQMLLSDSSFQAIMRKAVSFLTDGRGDNISLKLSSGENSFTDGKSITVGMEDYFFSPEFTRVDWVTVYKALLAHEVQHINSSNFSDIKDIMSKYAKIMSGTAIPEKLAMKIGKDYLNILEDGRIENIIIHKLPGYRLPLMLMNQSISVLSELEGQAKTPGEEFQDFRNTCLCYTKTGHLPRGISFYAGTRFEKEMKGVMPLIDLAVDARTSKDCKNLCLRFLKKTADYFADLLKEEIDQQMAAGSSGDTKENDVPNGGNEYTCNGEHEFNDSPNGSEAERKAKEKEADGDNKSRGKKKAGSKSSHNSKDGDSDGKGAGKSKSKSKNADDSDESGGEAGDQGSQSGTPGETNNTGRNALRMPRDPSTRSGTTDWTDDFSGDGAEDYDTRELTPEEIQALRRGVKDELDAIEEGETTEISKEERDRKKIEEKYNKERIRSFVELFPVISNEKLPQEMERIGRKLENDVERVIRVKRTEKRNMRMGQVSGRDLYRVGMRDPHVFMRKGQPMNADMAVFLLLDNSGSMGSMGAQTEINGEEIYLDKSTLSRTAAGIIERGLSKFAAMKISLFDVSGGQIRHSTVKKFDERCTGGSKCYNSINPVGIGGGNKDGYSIRVATADLMARREKKKVLVLLSDGLPSDYNGGTRTGMSDVHEAVREARQKGIIVIPIMFGRASDRQKMKNNFVEMYGQFISCDPIDIIGEFTKLFTKLVQNA